MRRRIIVIGILLVFLVYCVLAFRRQALYAVPPYRVSTLDIRAGATSTQWDSPEYASERHQCLGAYERRLLQLKESVELGDDGRLDAGRVLTAADYERLLQNGIEQVDILDPADMLSFSERDLHLRNDIASPAPGEEPAALLIASAGDKVTKELLDRCIDAGITSIPVVGAGDVVGFNATVLMVILIFVGMTLALTEIFWEPTLAHMNARREEIEAGLQATATSASLNAQLEETKLERRRAIRDGYQKTISEAKTDALSEANRILRHARNHFRQVREDSMTSLHQEVSDANAALTAEVPVLADMLVEKIVGEKTS